MEMAKAKTTTKDTKKDAKKDEQLKVTQRLNDVESSTKLYLDRLRDEIRQGYREFEYQASSEEEPKMFRIYMPTPGNDNEITRFKSRRSTTLLKDTDYMTKDEVMQQLTVRGVWDEEKTIKEEKLQERLNACLRDMYLENSSKIKDYEAMRELELERATVQLDMALLSQSKDTFLDGTIETTLDRDVLRYKLILLVKDSEGERIWNSEESYDEYADKGLIKEAMEKAIFFWQGLDQSLFEYAPKSEEETPESEGQENSDNLQETPTGN
jgi:hypothetical protein